jgi:hypothetical protein
MEYLGTGFVLTIGGMRLRVRIALEETPCEPPPRVRHAAYGDDGRDARAAPSRGASSLN